ncbi:MAG TPA: GAF domain-containing protein [Thermoguttaceae bacterium]|nr:GAF domain-containing protein [Thermoguttaceae bacterium]
MDHVTEHSPVSAVGEAAVPSPPASTTTSVEQQEAGWLKRQEALVAMGRRALASPEVSILMQDAAELLAEILDTEGSAAVEILPEADGLQMRLSFGKAGKADTPDAVYRIGAAATESFAGHALQVAQPVVVEDLPHEKQFDDMVLRELKIKSGLAVPLSLQDRSFGVLMALSREQRRFDDEDVLFVETIAHLVAVTIARQQAERALAKERRRTAEVLQTVDALVVTLDPRWQVVDLNPSCRQATGFSLEEIKNREFWNVFPVPEEAEKLKRRLQGVRAGSSPVKYEGNLLTKHGQHRWVAWSCRSIAADDGSVESILVTGLDLTERHEAEKRAARAEQAAEDARQGSSGTFNRLPTPASERRTRPRRSYPYRQKIAPIMEGNLPDLDRFEGIQCNDIAAGGFSFVCAAPPASDTLVVELGVPPKLSYLIAQVAHVTRVENDGQRQFIVGCNYVGRADY